MIGLFQFFILKQMELETIPSYFWILSLSTILVAFGGYIINDFFDKEIDKINRPGKNLFEVNFIKKAGIGLYLGIFLISLLLPFAVGEESLALTMLLFNAVMFLYAYWAKKQPIIGNVLVAASMAAVPFVFFLVDKGNVVWNSSLANNGMLIVIYGSFAFLLAFAREIVKDLEDVEGDKSLGLKTAAITFSMAFNKAMIGTFLVLNIALLGTTIWAILTEKLVFSSVSAYYFIFLLIPISIKALNMLARAKEKEDWTKLSQWLKMIMLAGIISIAIV